MQQANKIYKWKDFDKIVINTDDCENNSADYSYSHQEDINKTIPDFNFHAWREVETNDYSDFINDIHLSGLKSPEINKVGGLEVLMPIIYAINYMILVKKIMIVWK